MKNKTLSFTGKWHGGIVSNLEDMFLSECISISQQKRKFMDFKRNPIFTKVIGNDIRSKNISDVFYNFVKDTELINNIEKYKTNDVIGNPVLYEYDKIGTISPGTLCFLSILNDINTRLVDVKDKDVCEIGSGYGGQAKILLDYGVRNMDIIDRKETLSLASKYLSVFRYNNLNAHTVDNIETKNYDVVISNWCLSELDREGMTFYINNVIKRSNHGYFLTNFRDRMGNHEWLHEQLLDVFDEVKVEDENPKTSDQANYVFLCKNNRHLNE